MTTTFRAGKLAAVAVDKVDASLFLNSFDYSRTLSTAETTHFQSQAKEFIAGIADTTVNLAGMYDYANHLTAPAAEPGSGDFILDALASQAADVPVVLFPDAGVNPGARCMIVLAKTTSYAPSAPIGGVVSVKVGFQCNGIPNDGYALSSYAALSTATTQNYASVDLGAVPASTTAGGVATVHAVANSWTGSATVKVQHSVDNSVWVDLLTQVVPASTQAAYILPVAAGTTINRYVRAQITTAAGSGSIQTLVAFARS
jgi:hypothetical protein